MNDKTLLLLFRVFEKRSECGCGYGCGYCMLCLATSIQAASVPISESCVKG